MILMIVLTHQGKDLVLTSLKQNQNNAWVCIAMVIVDIFLSIKKPISLKLIKKTSTFLLGFA